MCSLHSCSRKRSPNHGPSLQASATATATAAAPLALVSDSLLGPLSLQRIALKPSPPRPAADAKGTHTHLRVHELAAPIVATQTARRGAGAGARALTADRAYNGVILDRRSKRSKGYTRHDWTLDFERVALEAGGARAATGAKGAHADVVVCVGGAAVVWALSCGGKGRGC